MKRITLKDFKEITKGLPDSAILCMYSDSEGNEQSTCLDVFVDTVGRRELITVAGTGYNFTTGEDIQGIDMDEDNGKWIVILQPSL
jgi:hypothetical protein